MYQEATSLTVLSSHPLSSCALRVGRFRFVIAPKETLFVPAVNKGNMLRGGFGHAFRRLCCVPECKDAHTCPVAMTCPYRTVFEPSPPPETESLSKNLDIPRPFIFRAPRTCQTRFEAGQPFEFELILIGTAVDLLSYFVLSFRELAAQGLGLNRAKGDLEIVEQLGPSQNSTDDASGRPAVLYSSREQILHKPRPCDAAAWVERRIEDYTASKCDSGVEHITIRFITPTLLKSDGEIIGHPDFHHVFKRLRDRINALSTFFGEGAIQADFRGLGERAEKVRTVSADMEWGERSRTSSKTKRRHQLSGFTGVASYEGELGEFLPWLAVGELTHVGKHTAWGNGWMEVGFGNGAS
jgi:hypothetical protein